MSRVVPPVAGVGRSEAPRGRRADLDHLKVALTALVLVHHLAISFGAAGSWYFVDPEAPPSLGLSVLTALDQSFFMGLFFFISGYFTPASFERKGAARFVAERTRRLLVPVVVFAIAVAPWLEYVKRRSHGLPTPAPGAYYLARVADWRELDPGPLWFVWALWLASLGYAALREIRAPRPRGPVASGDLRLIAFAIGLGLISFLTRIVAPIGWNFLHIQIAYAPQYIAMFSVGVQVGQRSAVPELTRERLVRWIMLATLAVIGAGVVFVGLAGGDPAQLRGGVHGPALGWAITESMTGVAISVCMLIGFGTWVSRPSRLGTQLTGAAYATYVLHAPVVVAVAVGVSYLSLPALAGFGLSIVIAVPAAFAIGALARRLPGVATIL